jgi:Na+/melibiose symporter-like transporter
MRILLRVIAVVMALIAALLIYAVIAAASSDGGAKAGVAIAYIIGAIVLLVGASALWRRPARPAGPAV